MNIRTRLTLRFILIAAIIMIMSSVLIYVFSADYREDDFYNRLHNKANNTAKLLIEVEGVDATLLRRIEQDNPVALPNEKIVIYNFRDSILFSTDEEHVLKINPEIINSVRLEEEIRYMQGDYEVLGFLFQGEFDRFVVMASATDIYGIKRLQNLLYILLFVFAISMVILSISGWLFAGQALQPIAKVVDQVSEISISSLNLRVDEGNGKDEIARLAMTFNRMLTRLEASFITQRNFIANASHELRTPLTVVTGQLEVTLLNTRSENEYKQTIQSVLDDIKSLNKLANKLLLLAQSSSEEREKRMQPLRIDELIWQVTDELQRHNAAFTINIDLDQNLDDENLLTVKGDEQLLKAALVNLIENGCKYSQNKTTNIFITASFNGLRIVFKDNGIGIPVDDLPNIFEPFYRGSNTSNIKGHGIGLSMVRGIVRLHRGVIEIESTEGSGTIITVILPVFEIADQSRKGTRRR
ncbi:MAG TPA: HAMP domain-containing sensor histidine kinase [Chryseosolibacter sp.]|nr:HAMP domain-containing sensor histidine kinase [Chryseosolibacter sp.]